jgi:hypothetical protein
MNTAAANWSGNCFNSRSASVQCIQTRLSDECYFHETKQLRSSSILHTDEIGDCIFAWVECLSLRSTWKQNFVTKLSNTIKHPVRIAPCSFMTTVALRMSLTGVPRAGPASPPRMPPPPIAADGDEPEAEALEVLPYPSSPRPCCRANSLLARRDADQSTAKYVKRVHSQNAKSYVVIIAKEDERDTEVKNPPIF